MTPEAGRFIKQANICIGRAETMLSVELYEDAARTAYLACFHAAQAYNFEKTRRSSKTHHGVQTEFFRLSKDDARVDPDLRRFLSESYEFKAAADYFTAEPSTISSQQAADAIPTAKRFVLHLVEALGDLG